MSRPHRLSDRDLHEAPYLLVLLLAAAGVLYATVFSSHWLRGIGVIGLAVVLGGVFRLVLTERQAGQLAVRHRPFDVTCYLLFGAGIIVVGVITQNLATRH